MPLKSVKSRLLLAAPMACDVTIEITPPEPLLASSAPRRPLLLSVSETQNFMQKTLMSANETYLNKREWLQFYADNDNPLKKTCQASPVTSDVIVAVFVPHNKQQQASLTLFEMPHVGKRLVAPNKKEVNVGIERGFQSDQLSHNASGFDHSATGKPPVSEKEEEEVGEEKKLGFEKEACEMSENLAGDAESKQNQKLPNAGNDDGTENENEDDRNDSSESALLTIPLQRAVGVSMAWSPSGRYVAVTVQFEGPHSAQRVVSSAQSPKLDSPTYYGSTRLLLIDTLNLIDSFVDRCVFKNVKSGSNVASGGEESLGAIHAVEWSCRRGNLSTAGGLLSSAAFRSVASAVGSTTSSISGQVGEQSEIKGAEKKVEEVLVAHGTMPNSCLTLFTPQGHALFRIGVFPCNQLRWNHASYFCKTAHVGCALLRSHSKIGQRYADVSDSLILCVGLGNLAGDGKVLNRGLIPIAHKDKIIFDGIEAEMRRAGNLSAEIVQKNSVLTDKSTTLTTSTSKKRKNKKNTKRKDVGGDKNESGATEEIENVEVTPCSREMGSIRDKCSEVYWSPCGQWFCTAILFSRLRVDNRIRVWSAKGVLLHTLRCDMSRAPVALVPSPGSGPISTQRVETKLNEQDALLFPGPLMQICWLPFPPGTFVETAPSDVFKFKALTLSGEADKQNSNFCSSSASPDFLISEATRQKRNENEKESTSASVNAAPALFKPRGGGSDAVRAVLQGNRPLGEGGGGTSPAAGVQKKTIVGACVAQKPSRRR